MNSSGSTYGRDGKLHSGFENSTPPETEHGIKVASIPNLYGKLEEWFTDTALG
jgi:hypothetical protein